MKQKRKTISKLLIFGIFFMLFGCSEDLYETENKNQYGFKVSHKKFQDLLQQPKFKKAITKIEKEREKENLSTNKTIMEVQYGFTIVEDIVNVLENNTITSYTLLVTRENTPENVVENLIIQVKSQNEITAFLLKYTNESDFYDGFNMKDFQGTKTLIPIIYNINQVNTTGKMVYVEVCSTLTSWYCYGPGHHSDSDGCTMGFPISQEVCSTYGYDDGMGGGSPGGGGGGGTYSSNTPTDPTILTSPTPPVKNFDRLKTPCVKLKKLFDPAKANIKPNIVNDLQPNIAVNPSGEKGASLAMNSSGVPTNTVIPPTSTNSVGIPTGSNYYSGIHTHPLDTYPMFSWSDVVVLNTLNNNSSSHNQGLASFLLVCQDDNGVFQTYAIVFDLDSLNDTIDQFMGNPENNGCTSQEIELKMNNLLGEEYLKDSNYERAFLKFMSSSNVSLYRANSTLTNWSKLTLSNNSATATVNSTNCN